MREVGTIERIITPSLEALGFRIVRLSFGGGGRPTLQVMAEPIDGGAMTVDHCAEISRTVSALLDVEDPIPVAYTLEVTSPGIDRPLVKPDDYSRFAGLVAKIELGRPMEGRKRFRGRLKGLDGQGNVVVDAEEAGMVTLPFADILRAKLVLTDELLAAAQAAEPGSPDDSPDGGPARPPGATA